MLIIGYITAGVQLKSAAPRLTRQTLIPHRGDYTKRITIMNLFEHLQLQINTVLGALIHQGSSTSSALAYGLGLF